MSIWVIGSRDNVLYGMHSSGTSVTKAVTGPAVAILGKLEKFIIISISKHKPRDNKRRR
jgi:hypothetical protein